MQSVDTLIILHRNTQKAFIKYTWVRKRQINLILSNKEQYHYVYDIYISVFVISILINIKLYDRALKAISTGVVN